jgi:hypothetical protein
MFLPFVKWFYSKLTDIHLHENLKIGSVCICPIAPMEGYSDFCHGLGLQEVGGSPGYQHTVSISPLAQSSTK